MKICWWIKLILHSKIWWSGMRLRMPKKHGVWTAYCIRGYHAAVGELFTFKREWKNAVGTYYGSKDRQFIRHWEHRITEGAIYVLPRGWYVCVCMCPTFKVVCICVYVSNMVVVCVHTYTYKPPSRYHIIETLMMMKGHRVTAHALHPEYWVVRFQRHKLGQTLGWFQGYSPAFQLIPRNQET